METLQKLNKTIRSLTKSGKPRKVRRDKGKKRSIKEQVKAMRIRKFNEVQNEH